HREPGFPREYRDAGRSYNQSLSVTESAGLPGECAILPVADRLLNYPYHVPPHVVDTDWSRFASPRPSKLPSAATSHVRGSAAFEGDRRSEVLKNSVIPRKSCLLGGQVVERWAGFQKTRRRFRQASDDLGNRRYGARKLARNGILLRQRR